MTLRMSYVVVTDTFELIRDVVRAVAGSTIADAVELVVVFPRGTEFRLDRSVTHGIGAVRLVEAEAVVPLSPARAVGIRAATCDTVFIGETHSFPEPRCLEALAEAHASGSYAVVTPVIENANPAKAMSWASLMLTYRHWLEPAARVEVASISTYNACFRRADLLAFGPRLEAMLDYGSGMDVELRKSGGTFLMEPAARLGHLNVAGFNAWIPERVLSGRFWGSARSRDWSPWRRLLYVAAAPILPVMIAGKAIASPQWKHHRDRMPTWTTPATIACAIATAVGEAMAYAFGPGTTPVRLAEYELHRIRYL